MEQSASVTLNEFDGKVLVPAITFHLPANLSTKQFHSLIPCASSISSAPALGFPALQNWLTNLLANLRLQGNVDHPYREHPYRLRQIVVQAVDWFSETKIGFMKMRASIETAQYVHEGEQEARPDWLPGAVFLRGGSVAMLVSYQSL
jgi:ADP-sugar diphosphatase